MNYKCIFTRNPSSTLVSISLASLLALCPCQNLWGQNNSPTKTDTLGTAVVTGYAAKGDMQQAVPTQQLTSVQMQQMGVSDIGGALRRLSGLQLRDYGGAGGLKTVSARGLGAAHTVVAYDGLALGDARQGQTDLSRFNTEYLDGLTLSIADVPNLLCPVRNLGAALLEMHPQQTDSTRRLSGRAGINVGSFGAVAPSLRLLGKCTDRVTLGLSSHFYRADNNYPFILQNGKITTHETRDHSHMQAYTVQGDLSATDQAGGKWQMLLFYNNDDRELPGQVLYYTQKGTESLDKQTAFAQLRQERRWNDWKWMCAAKFSFSESLYDDTNPQYPTGALQQNYWQREWYATTGLMRHFQRFSAAYAADYTYTSLNSNQKAAPRAQRHSLQQALSLRYTHRVLTATARVLAYDDWNSCPVGEAAQNAHHISPTADVTAHLVSWHKGAEHWGRLRARVLYKESYRVPTFSETYYYHLGTQRLRPELARQTGAGLTLQTQPAPWWQNLEVSADAYFNHVRDRISAIPYNLYVWQTVNMGLVNIWGTDVTLHSTFRPAERHLLLLHTNYSWQKATDRTDPTSRSYGKQPAYMPQHTLGASLAWENPWANLSISLTALSERWSTNEHAAGTLLPAYAEWGVGAYREVKLPRGVRLNLRADVLNLFNKQYEIVRRYPMPGRHWKVGATIAF